jgi:hypothetical protein
VAIKIPRRDQISSAEADAFFREARAAAQLRNPRIVGVHEMGREAGMIHIESVFIEGATFKEWLSSQRASPREAAELVVKVAEVLHHAHEAGVVQRTRRGEMNAWQPDAHSGCGSKFLRSFAKCFSNAGPAEASSSALASDSDPFGQRWSLEDPVSYREGISQASAVCYSFSYSCYSVSRTPVESPQARKKNFPQNRLRQI